MPETILDSSEEKLRTAQAKITYLGEQRAAVQTIAFHGPAISLSVDGFARVQRGGRTYVNDTLPLSVVELTPQEFRRVLESVKTVLLAPTAEAGGECLSFTVVRWEKDGWVGDEFRVGYGSAENFYRALLQAIGDANAPVRLATQRQFQAVCPGASK